MQAFCNTSGDFQIKKTVDIGFNKYHKNPNVITYMCQNFDVHDVLRQIPKSTCQKSYLLFNDFPNNFSETRSYLNRMKDITKF